ncbi:hypothetical protein GCM10007079_21550 [Nocardiopsis terrae]|uniref:ABC-type uncharacterized transport system ATPase subunit n=1 Tax=Nocardiopsis terrae TaxID=372655 RepID=A0ABR9HGS8_9ACTN|nr:ABC-type uncharacterized transport system ATPase subunit [Nocardiopsis terrae]GHC81508.1 hypothetical protein GCM10007079_21550 [Nocardiopsis terrae]
MNQHTPRPAVTATGLRKSYGDHTVLDGIDLDVPAGTVFSLLGPNGAGKTTVVKILSTLINADRARRRTTELLERFDLVEAGGNRPSPTPGACAAVSTWR